MDNPFLKLFKDKEFDSFNSNIDKLIVTLAQSSEHDTTVNNVKSDEDYSKLVTSLVSDNTTVGSNIQTLLQSITVPEERLARYNIYDEIYKSVPLIKRIFKVYISNIIQKNPVDGKSVIIRNKFVDKNKQISFLSKKFMDKTLDYFDIIKKYKYIILPRKMLYGDCYVEVINTDSIDIDYIINPTSKTKKDTSTTVFSTLTESKILSDKITKILTYEKTINENNNTIYQSSQLLTQLTDILFEVVSEPVVSTAQDDIISLFENNMDDNSDIIDTSEFKSEYAQYLKDVFYEEQVSDPDNTTNDESTSDVQDNADKLNAVKFEKILLKIHKPHNIIVLETQYGTRLGYLEISSKQKLNSSDSMSMNNIVSKITSLGNKTNTTHDDVMNSISRALVQKVFKMYADKNKLKVSKDSSNSNSKKEAAFDSSEILNMLDNGSLDLIKQLIISQNLINDKTKKGTLQPYKVRFIPVSNMVSFSNPSLDYAPYSESIVENLILPSKLFILSQLCNHIIKFSRASLIRTWTIEQGSSQSGSQLVQKLKRELLSTKTSLNDLSTFKNTNKILSDFKDMVTLTKQGQKVVDVNVQALGDPSIRVQDLEDARKEIIALSGVPTSLVK